MTAQAAWDNQDGEYIMTDEHNLLQRIVITKDVLHQGNRFIFSQDQ
jgi:hypothetical protein